MKVAFVGDTERLAALERLAVAAGSEIDPGADLVFLDVSELRAHLRSAPLEPRHRAVLVHRGLEPDGTLPSAVLAAETACLRVGALAGPIVAGEVRRGSPIAAVVASPYREVQRLAAAALHSPACRVYASDDLVGVELAGAHLEVVAAALGAARGLGMGVGLQSLVVTRGIAEGARLAASAGADPRTFAGLAGAGELVVCLGIPDHPGVMRGLALARNEPDPLLGELCDALLARARDLPITQGVREVARGRWKALDALNALLSRDQREEHGARDARVDRG